MVTADAREERGVFLPRTPLTERLWALRKRIVASGRPLLDWADIARREERMDAFVERAGMAAMPLPAAAWFAEHVMGWPVCTCNGPEWDCACAKPFLRMYGDVAVLHPSEGFNRPWNPSEHIADAMQVLDSMHLCHPCWSITLSWHADGARQCDIFHIDHSFNPYRGRGMTPAHAICRAVEAWGREIL